ncbi:MAG: carbon-nitrogen hydrolase family protein [Synergistaceae bacterium]|nr:carbon-nitrogen hydrolase family protein [Synergistaceae bacterium]
MKIAMAQMKMSDSMEENFRKSLSAIEEAARNKADLVFFPEVQLSPFFPQYRGLSGGAERYALTTEHEYIRQMADLCRERRIMASPNVYLREDGAYYDASLFISAEGKIQGISRMVHIMQCPFFYEQDYYSPSNDGFRVYETPFGGVGIVICFDRHLPESVRTCALLGADLVLIPTANTDGEPMELFEWEIRVQAMHSGVYIAMCNRVGREDAMNFIGQSLVADTKGGLLVRAGENEGLTYAEPDLEKSRKERSNNPYFTLRRPQFYK